MAGSESGSAPGASPLTLNGSWSLDTEVYGNSSGEIYADTAVTFKGEVYLFGIGVGDKRIYLNHGNPATQQWSGWHGILAGSYTYTSVAAAVYEGKLYVMWIDNSSLHIYAASSSDGSTFSAPVLVCSYLSASMMSATVWYGRLYLFFKKYETYPHHYYATFNGNSWNGPVAVDPTHWAWTSYADAATVYANKLWLFGIGTDNTMWYDNWDGYTWSGWTRVDGGGTTAVPTYAITYNNRLHLFAIGTGDHQHYVNVYDGVNWTGWYLLSGLVNSTVSDTAAVFQDKLWLFSVNYINGRHYVASCLSTVSCGGGTDNGDAILYQDSCGSGNQVKLAAESAKAETLYPTSFYWPDGHTLFEEPARCVWLRSGYRFTYGALERLGGAQGTIEIPGTFSLGGVQSFALSRNPPAVGPLSVGGVSQCTEPWTEDGFTGATHSDTHWYVSHNTGVRRYPAQYSLCDASYGGDVAVDYGAYGAHHTGSPTFSDGYLYLTIAYNNWAQQYTFVFNRDLVLETALDPISGDWLAINPVDGLIYGGVWQDGPPYTHPPWIVSYERLYFPGIDYPVAVQQMPYSPIDLTRHFTPPDGDALRQVQAAAFSPSGYLYLFDQGGGHRVFVFRIEGQDAYPVTWWNVATEFEPEGMVLWDFGIRTDLPPLATGGGQIHALSKGFDPWPPDSVWVHSYSVPHWAY